MKQIILEGSQEVRVPKRILLPLLSLLLLGCGEAVTNPFNEGFEADPAPILGTWHLVAQDGTTDPRYPLVIERGSDFLFGEVQFPMFSRDWQMFFSDVRSWDGEGFHFYHSETHGLTIDSLRWDVGYRPKIERSCPPGWLGDNPDTPASMILSGIREFRYMRPGSGTPPESDPCRPPD